MKIHYVKRGAQQDRYLGTITVPESDAMEAMARMSMEARALGYSLRVHENHAPDWLRVYVIQRPAPPHHRSTHTTQRRLPMEDADQIQATHAALPPWPQQAPGAQGIRRPDPIEDGDSLAEMTPDEIIWQALRVRGKGYTVPALVERLLRRTLEDIGSGEKEREAAILDLDNALQIRLLEPLRPASALGGALWLWTVRQVDTEALARRLLQEGMPAPF